MAAKQAIWMRKFISELGVVPTIADPIGLYCNRAIALAKQPQSYQWSLHIQRKYHLIREFIDRGEVRICRVSTLDNIADPLTKALSQQKHDGHTRSMGIRLMSEWLKWEIVSVVCPRAWFMYIDSIMIMK